MSCGAVTVLELRVENCISRFVANVRIQHLQSVIRCIYRRPQAAHDRSLLRAMTVAYQPKIYISIAMTVNADDLRKRRDR